MEFVEPIRDLKQIKAIKGLLVNNKRDLLLFTLGINTALRVQDLLNLKWCDLVDAKGKPLEHIKLVETKTEKNNKITINNSAQKAIIEWYKEAYKGDMQHYVFTSRKGDNKPIQRQMAWRLIKKVANDVGVKDIGTHSMRKTFAYHQYKLGTDITLLQDMLNHSSPAVTLRYIGITQDEKDRAIRSMDL